MCQICTRYPQRKETFAEKLLLVLNHASLGVMISLGHRTGLFNALEHAGEVSVQELAEKARLNPRYVKEWLAALCAGRIVEYEPSRQTYRLPEEHAAFLTTAAGPENFATLFQYVPVMAGVEDELIRCFRMGGGVPYEKFHRFHEVMAEESGQHFKTNMLTKVLPLQEGCIDALEKGIQVLDVGCGSGTAMNTLARIFPESRFTGLDISPEPLKQARKDAQMLGLMNVNFLLEDAAKMNLTERFELITAFDSIHDQAHPDIVLKNIYRQLKSKGSFFMVDIDASSKLEENLDHPLAPTLYSMSVAHCMTVSLSQGGMGLGSMWGLQKALEMLREAGFTNTKIEHVEKDIMNAYYISTK